MFWVIFAAVNVVAAVIAGKYGGDDGSGATAS
jgi:hypothetical protein